MTEREWDKLLPEEHLSAIVDKLHQLETLPMLVSGINYRDELQYSWSDGFSQLQQPFPLVVVQERCVFCARVYRGRRPDADQCEFIKK